MKKVLIVGAGGFLGRSLTQKCLAEGWLVDALLRKKSAGLPAEIRNVIESCEPLPAETYDYIFNAAAFIPYGKLNKPDERLLHSNIDLPSRLYKAYPQAKMIFASSVSVYGANKGVLTEKSETISPSLYGLSKLAGELVCAHHRNYSVLRFSSLYGKGMFQQTFIPAIILDAKNKGVITLSGDGSRLQNYLHVEDASRFCIQAAMYGENEIYLGTSANSISNKDLATIISQNSKCKIDYSGTDESPSFVYDNQFTLKALRMPTVVDLEEGLKELL